MAVGSLAAFVLFGCSTKQDMGTFFVDPGRYSAFHCKDFAPALAAQTTRERDLRNLMDRASEGGGGAVIGNLSYRADYEKVLAEETELRRAAAEKNCDLGAPAYQSDRTIR